VRAAVAGTVGTGLFTVSVRSWSSVWPALVTRTVNLVLPATVGVPSSNPVLASVSPAGSRFERGASAQL
jgi:hypothetical protein